MITSVNSNNSASYQKLYAEVTEYLSTHDENGYAVGDEKYTGPVLLELYEYKTTEDGSYLLDDEGNRISVEIEGKRISSLSQLFSWMHELRVLEPKYTILPLPLDESVFKIDLNTRTITVPDFFAKNGISVKGDAIAESLYFRCDRYYDHMDLATQNIYIEYTNASGDSRVAIPAVVDIETYPNEIVFEWAISETVTAAAGNISFGVRFYTYAPGMTELYYSLSTLTQTVKINSGLDFDITSGSNTQVQEDDNKELMENRLTDKVLYGANTAIAKAPIFFEDFNLKDTMNLAKDDNQFTTVAIDMPVEAYNEDGGQITYTWFKRSLGSYKYFNDEGAVVENTEVPLSDLPITYEQKFVETTDTEINPKKVYYIASGTTAAGANAYSLLGNISSWPVDEEGNAVTCYERQSIAKIDSVGYYRAQAANRVGAEKAYAATPDNEDGFMLVPAATAFENEIVIAERGIFDVVTDEDDNVSYSLNITADETVVESPDKESGGKLTYEWFYTPAGSEKETSTTVTENVLALDEANEGKYRVLVTNNRNKTIEQAYSTYCRVTKPAEAPEVNLPDNGAFAAYYKGSEDTIYMTFETLANAKAYGYAVNEVVAPESNREAGDTITYQWYEYVEGRWTTPSDTIGCIKEAYAGTYWDGDSTKSNADKAIEGATSAVFRNMELGKLYYCIVTNTYNGSIARTSSPFFSVLQGTEE